MALSRMRSDVDGGLSRRSLDARTLTRNDTALASGHCSDETLDAVHSRRTIVSNQKLPAVSVHQCPSCHQPQTKIKRVLGDGKFGSSNFVCSRMECALAIDVSKLKTWVTE
jgi:hypothetical protein